MIKNSRICLIHALNGNFNTDVLVYAKCHLLCILYYCGLFLTAEQSFIDSFDNVLAAQSHCFSVEISASLM
jgi:hypothetical protein